ncbi:hypothetical protein EDB85DRAFT_1897261 [Lactarius pseudohatsudake]|nr:hypothetical protein EDB85DRAFT_1897261 [Lactarius pseudohatsudake]
MTQATNDGDGGHRRRQQYSDDNNTAMIATVTERHPQPQWSDHVRDHSNLNARRRTAQVGYRFPFNGSHQARSGHSQAERGDYPRTYAEVSSLLTGIGTSVDKFLRECMAHGYVVTDPRWQIGGHGGITQAEVKVIGAVHVSAGSWVPIIQPSFRLFFWNHILGAFGWTRPDYVSAVDVSCGHPDPAWTPSRTPPTTHSASLSYLWILEHCRARLSFEGGGGNRQFNIPAGIPGLLNTQICHCNTTVVRYATARPPSNRHHNQTTDWESAQGINNKKAGVAPSSRPTIGGQGPIYEDDGEVTWVRGRCKAVHLFGDGERAVQSSSPGGEDPRRTKPARITGTHHTACRIQSTYLPRAPGTPRVVMRNGDYLDNRHYSAIRVHPRKSAGTAKVPESPRAANGESQYCGRLARALNRSVWRQEGRGLVVARKYLNCLAVRKTGGSTKCFSIVDEGFAFPRRGRDGRVGPSRSELMKVVKHGAS